MKNIVTSVIAGNTLLTGKTCFLVAGECEVKNAQAMKIMGRIWKQVGSFSEFLCDGFFNDDIIMLGT